MDWEGHGHNSFVSYIPTGTVLQDKCNHDTLRVWPLKGVMRYS